jgi:hypothetical protein
MNGVVEANTTNDASNGSGKAGHPVPAVSAAAAASASSSWRASLRERGPPSSSSSSSAPSSSSSSFVRAMVASITAVGVVLCVGVLRGGASFAAGAGTVRIKQEAAAEEAAAPAHMMLVPPLEPILPSPLEVLYRQTHNGTTLKRWVRYHVRRTYPQFPDVGSDVDDDNDSGSGSNKNHRKELLVLGAPSLAHDFQTNRTVVGFRVGCKAMPLALHRQNYVMLCELVSGSSDNDDNDDDSTNNSRTTRAGDRRTWRCQDSGIENAYVPPQCDRRYWKHPAQKVFWGLTTTGVADPRLLFDFDTGQQQQQLRSTFVMRGCHPDTPYGNSTALYSVYTARWRRTHGTWRVDGYPTLLDVRAIDGSSLGAAYPPVTKSWITIPTTHDDTNHRLAATTSHDDDTQQSNHRLRFSVGWSQDMKRHVVYQVHEADGTGTRYAVTPLRQGANYTHLDLRNYRGSTNVVPFRGALLGIGHRRILPGTIYYHYWYAYCPMAPYYPAVALGEGMLLPQRPNVPISFALGLAVEGDHHLYFAWSENDRIPRLTRYTADDVLTAFRNSSFARSRGHSYENLANFTSLCADAVAAAEKEEGEVEVEGL